MKKEFLEGLKLDAAAIDAILKEAEKDIQSEKANFADYDDVKAQLETANATLEKFKDYEQTKAEVEKYKAELKKSQEESAAKIAEMERSAKVQDFLSDKKFVNTITQNAVKSQLSQMLADAKNAGKNLSDLFDEISKNNDNILSEENSPTPPVMQPMKNGTDSSSVDDAKIDAIMGIKREK